jgi:hypothetical protein
VNEIGPHLVPTRQVRNHEPLPAVFAVSNPPSGIIGAATTTSVRDSDGKGKRLLGLPWPETCMYSPVRGFSGPETVTKGSQVASTELARSCSMIHRSRVPENSVFSMSCGGGAGTLTLGRNGRHRMVRWRSRGQVGGSRPEFHGETRAFARTQRPSARHPLRFSAFLKQPRICRTPDQLSCRT